MRPTNRVLQDLQKRTKDIRTPEGAYGGQPDTVPAVRETDKEKTANTGSAWKNAAYQTFAQPDSPAAALGAAGGGL